MCRTVPFCAIDHRAENLVVRRHRLFADRSRARTIFALAADRRGTPRHLDRRSRADDLHLRHHRSAQGGQCQSPADHAMEPLVRRPDEYRAGRPHVRLPADVSFGRRGGRDRGAVGSRRIGRRPREILRKPILGRRRRLELHAISIYRRTLPLSRQCTGTSARTRAPLAASLRQRAACRHLGEIPVALRHSEGPGILRGDRGQCVAL